MMFVCAANVYYRMNMIKLALSFLLGVLIFQTSRELPTFHYLFLIPIFGLIWLKFPQVLPVFIALLAFGWTHIFAYQQLNPQMSSVLEGEDIDVEAVVEEVTSQDHHYGKFVLNLTQKSLNEWGERIPKKLQLSWYRPQQTIHVGQVCHITVRLKKHWGFSNPGSNDYEKSMFLRGIGARGYIRQGQCNEMQNNDVDFFNLRKRWVNEFLQLSDGYRFANLMQALTFGYRENMDQSQWQVLRRTGTAHLLAISGLHISSVAFIVFLIVVRLCRLSATLCNVVPAQRIAAYGAIIVTLFYAYLAGYSLPTQRALIMVVIAFSAILYNRPVFNLSVFSAALLLVLLVNPLVVLTAGFWMSFLAVLFIFIAVKASRTRSKLTRIIFVQVYLGIALFPIGLLYFSQASIIAPVVNLIAIPFVSFIVLPLLLLAQCGFLLGVAGIDNLYELIDVLFAGLWWCLELFSSVQYASWQYHPSIMGVICFEIGLFILIQAKGLPAKHLSWFLIAALFLLKEPSLKSGQMRMTILDVGQGLAIVIETVNHAMLYDAGVRSLSGFNTGKVVVKPYLDWRGIHEVDIAMVSHNDNDHAGGMHWLLNNLAIKQLLVSNQQYLYQHNNIDVCRAGDKWVWDGVYFQVLHPPERWRSNDNNRSCVMQISHPSGKILLTGDIEKLAEEWLIKQYGDNLASDLMSAPHHGSKSSSSYRFVDRVHPQTVLFSAGYRNRFGFPHATISQRYEKLGAQNVDTIRQGAVTFLLDPETGINMQTGNRFKHQRYWHSTTEKLTDPKE